MKKYRILENGKPCDVIGYPITRNLIWNRSVYDTFEEAKEYVIEWFHPYITKELADKVLKLNTPYDYNGYGDTVEIKEIETDL